MLAYKFDCISFISLLTLIYSHQTEIGESMRNALGQFVASHTGNAGLSSDKVRNFTLESVALGPR